MNTKIYVCTHKKFDCPSLEGYIPLEVGSDIHTADLNYLKDNTNDNISHKNSNYCELTGLYWIWKNDKSSDIVGLCHYRRYFSRFLLNTSEKYYLTTKKIEKILSKYDIILPEKYIWKRFVVWVAYYKAGPGKKKDLQCLEQVVAEKFPAYSEAFLKVVSRRDASYCNMMICSKELLDEYCEWLFDILFEVERRVDISGYTTEEARIFGYMSEILLNVWCEYKKLKVKHVSVTVLKELSKKHKFLFYLEKIPVVRVLSRRVLYK